MAYEHCEGNQGDDAADRAEEQAYRELEDAREDWAEYQARLAEAEAEAEAEGEEGDDDSEW